jgi:hypothetical protein
MTTPSNPSDPFTPFLPSTYNIPEENDRIDIFLQDTFSLQSDIINDKSIGTMVQGNQNFNGEKWWYKDTKITRNGYQTFCYIPSYPNAGVLTFTLTDIDPNLVFPITGIDPEFVITLTYGTASKPPSAIGAGDGDYFTFMNKGDSRVSWTMSDTTIVVTTTVNLRAYSGFLVIKYLRNGV